MRTRIKFVALLMLISVSVVSQNDSLPELKGGIGLTFGMPIMEVSQALINKGGKPDIGLLKTDYIVVDNVLVGGRKTVFVSASFVDKKLCDINAYFNSELDAKVQELFDSVKEDLESKYGASKCVRLFKGIYKDGDGYEMLAVKTGNADIACYWDGFRNGNTILLKITTSLAVSLNYQDSQLVNEKIKQNKKVISSDY